MFLKKVFNPSKAERRNPSATRNVKILKDDTFLVSYPKSGNTWLRFIIANLLVEDSERVTLSGLEDIVPDIYRNSNEKLSLISSPRILKSHEPFNHRYRKVIYIVRDPRDVAVSYYHHLIKARRIDEDYSLEKWVQDFLVGKFNSKFGTWREHVGSWIGARKENPDFLLISYEQLLDNSLGTVKKVSSFLHLNLPETKLQEAIDLSSVDRMRKIEIQENWQPNKGNMRTDKRFIRSGKSGGWRDELPPEYSARISEKWQSTIRELGYPV